jgi:hypothetical protein
MPSGCDYCYGSVLAAATHHKFPLKRGSSEPTAPIRCAGVVPPRASLRRAGVDLRIVLMCYCVFQTVPPFEKVFIYIKL